MDLEATVAEIAPNLLRYCVGITGDPALGEEIAQDALTVLVARWRNQGPPRSTQAFVYTVAKRLAWRTKWRHRFLVPLDLLVNGHNLSPDPEVVVRNREELDEALAAMKRLPAKDREALLLVVAGELDVSEAADVLSISHSALKMRVHRARRRLSSLLEKQT